MTIVDDLRASFTLSREREEWATGAGLPGVARAERKAQAFFANAVVRLTELERTCASC